MWRFFEFIISYLLRFRASSALMVVISTTPLTPLKPYIFEPLTISTDLTSYILISSRRVSMPSQRMSTAELPLIEFCVIRHNSPLIYLSPG